MVSEVQAVGIVLLVFGLPGALWPAKVAKVEEQIDAIGSTRSWSEIEPTNWKVGLTRAIGIVMVSIGTLWAIAG